MQKPYIGNSGIVYQYIQGAELFADLGKKIFTDGQIPNISQNSQAGNLVAFNFFFGLKQFGFSVGAVDYYIVSLFCKFYSNGFPDSPGSAGYKNYFFAIRSSPL